MEERAIRRNGGKGSHLFGRPLARAWAEAERLRRHEDKVLLLLTLLIGAVVGIVVVAFIVVTERLSARLLPPDGNPWRRLAVPLVGALGSGILLARYFPESRGSGIPQTKTALFLKHGHITLRTVIGKFTCASLSLASGIALGREGPTVQVGAGVASVLGRKLALGPRRVQALIPVGTAAAVAAAFNTPISAVLFTLEEILGDLHAPVLGSVVIASATSWAVLRLLLGDEPLFHVPAYQLVHPLELPVYAVLGLAGGLVSVAFVKLLLAMRARFLRLPRASVWWQPAVGGLAVGVMGWFVPDVLGVGYGHVGEALNGKLMFGAMALLLLLKVMATATCYASGNAGGIFGPSLFIGAMLGGTIGSMAHAAFPDITGSPGAYALVGMGTAFAGIVRAPMTSVLMIFEVTRDYSIIVPVMIANLLSYFIAQRMQPDPTYEALLHQDGIRLPPPRVVLGGMTAEQVMTPVHGIDGGRTVCEALRDVEEAAWAKEWPIVRGSLFLGMATRDGLLEAMDRGHGTRPVADLVTPPLPPLTADNFPHVHPDQGIDVVLQRMGESGLEVMPVVSRADVHDLLGIVALHHLPAAHRRGAGREPDAEAGHGDKPSVRTLLAAVVSGILGLFLLGGFLAHRYHSGRIENAQAAFGRGRELARDRRDPEAIEHFRSALSLVPSSDYRLALGLALERTGQDAEARVYLDEALRDRPGDGPANAALARIERRVKDLDAAKGAYARALRGTWPSGEQWRRTNVLFEFVDLLEREGGRRQAVAELLTESAREVPPETLERIARQLLKLDSNRQAEELFREVLKVQPRRATAYQGLAQALVERDDYQSARNAYQRALQLSPTDQAARQGLVLSEEVLSLDPQLRGLVARQRLERSRRLLEMVLARFEACPPGIPFDQQHQPAEKARRLLRGRSRRQGAATSPEEYIGTAEQLWALRPDDCREADENTAVGRVMRRIAR